MPSNFLQDFVNSILERTPKFGGTSDQRSIEELCTALLISTGENSIKKTGASILERYQTFEESEKLQFFLMLAERYDVDPGKISNLALRYKDEATVTNLATLLQASEPARQELLRRLNHVPGATQILVAMRADLLKMSRENEALRRVDLDFAHLFSSWFNRGFLVEKRVTWDSSASVLAKIIQYEAVHAINDWDDLRRRIQPPDRRCFAFFHPAMPNEPLVFVEVALCKGSPGSVQDLLKEARDPIKPTEADTAVFYSISNCQAGLRGISFGNSLIKQVATDLTRDLPQLSTFITLSPLPTFARWLRHESTEITPDELEALDAAASAFGETTDSGQFTRWSDALKHLGARYLYSAKREDGKPVDSVARFHLNNGAALHDIYAMADSSQNGLETSFGLMVSYHYDLKLVEQRHEDYSSEGKIIASKTIRNYAQNAVPRILIESKAT